MARGAEAGTERPAPRRIGVFGGTFDPPHVGHVAVAADVADALELDLLYWVPAAVSPFKVGRTCTPPGVRLEMVRAAAVGDDRFEVLDDEVRRGGVSYTVDTLRLLRRRHPGAQLFLILGADQVRSLDRWREAEEVLRLAVPAVMDREGAPALAGAPDLPGMERAVRVPVRRVDVSSTHVRSLVKGGGDARRLVPPAVWEVIRRHALYRPAGDAADGCAPNPGC